MKFLNSGIKHKKTRIFMGGLLNKITWLLLICSSYLRCTLVLFGICSQNKQDASLPYPRRRVDEALRRRCVCSLSDVCK